MFNLKIRLWGDDSPPYAITSGLPRIRLELIKKASGDGV
jgi:hypothetical protein